MFTVIVSVDLERIGAFLMGASFMDSTDSDDWSWLTSAMTFMEDTLSNDSERATEIMEDFEGEGVIWLFISLLEVLLLLLLLTLL